MKFKKPLSALVVSALLLGGASGALAASANLQLSLPTSEVPGGSHTQLTFTTNVPGFLTLTLNGPSGSLTLLDREEVHTAGNMFDFIAADDSGSPLSVGAYTVSGELIDQFGEATGSVSGQLTIGIPLAQQTDDERPRLREGQRLRVKGYRLVPVFLRLLCRARQTVFLWQKGEGGGICRFEQDHARRAGL